MEARIYHFSDWFMETQPSILKQTFDALLKEAGFTIIQSIEHQFSPIGYTALWLLAESHFAIHTFPEHGRTYLELSSCNEAMNTAFQAEYQAWKQTLTKSV